MAADPETVTPVDTLREISVGDPNATVSTYYDESADRHRHYVDPDELIESVKRAAHPKDEDELTPEQWKNSILPMDQLPSFGEPLEDCGQQIPASKHFCTECGYVHDFPRNCLRYDCPEHWAHAIRRRAAGSKYAAGVTPQMGALMGYLQHWREPQQFYHHLVVDVFEFGDGEFLLESDKPRERAFELVRELMDTLGIQGTVAYHPWKGKNGDDRGKWKQRIGSDRDWDGDVRDELEHNPHFHIVGVGPSIDLGDIGAFQSETGWVINRIADDESNVSIYDDEGMVDRVLYNMSHAGVYETAGGQRRLAVRMKGPDVNRVTPDRDTQYRFKKLVNKSAVDTLGIPMPDMECDKEIREEHDLGRNEQLPELDRSSTSPLADAWQPDSVAPTGTIVGTGQGLPRGGSGAPPDAVAGMATAPTDLDSSDGDLPSDASGSTGSSAASGSDSAPVDESDGDTDGDTDALERCGGRLEHISQAGDFLLDGERREAAPYADQLDRQYREYIDWMREQNLDPAEGRNEVTEFQDQTPGRKSKVLDEAGFPGSENDPPPD